jgi:hypothetical protein
VGMIETVIPQDRIRSLFNSVDVSLLASDATVFM